MGAKPDLTQSISRLLRDIYAQRTGLTNAPRRTDSPAERDHKAQVLAQSRQNAAALPTRPQPGFPYPLSAAAEAKEANTGWPSRQHERTDPYSRGPAAVGPYGWAPQKGDEELLARIIFAEGGITPQDNVAIGWSTVNRVNDRRYRKTLSEVLNQPGQYQIVQAGGGPPGGSSQFKLSAHPEQMTEADLDAWKRAKAISAGILGGAISDPTGGANHFFASASYQKGDPKTVNGWFRTAIKDKKIVDAPYRSGASGPVKNHFFVEVN